MENKEGDNCLEDDYYKDDRGSIFEDSSRMSLASSTNSYLLENHRKYHTYRDGSYWIPHDDEALRLDVIAHHMFLLTLNDRLFLAPLQNPSRVLDVGTGIGVWASDFADKFPDADVIGTDLAKCQRVPPAPNLRFETDDACSEWVYPLNHFDYIHARLLYASIADWPAFYKECYDHLAPGGYIEHAEHSPVMQSENGYEFDKDGTFQKCISLINESGRRFGKSLVIQPHLKDLIIKAGFVDVVEAKYTWPLGDWHPEPKLKTIGRWSQQHWLEGMEAWSMRLLTQHMGWSYEQVMKWVNDMQIAIRSNDKMHAYQPVSVVYARKPL